MRGSGFLMVARNFSSAEALWQVNSKHPLIILNMHQLKQAEDCRFPREFSVNVKIITSLLLLKLAFFSWWKVAMSCAEMIKRFTINESMNS